MKERYKNIGSILIILLLLPYILTLFLNGRNMQEGTYQVGERVMVEIDGVEKEVLWEEYLLGVVARSLPLKSDIESTKAQVVIARTNLYWSVRESDSQVFHEPYMTTEEMGEKWTETSVEIYKQLKTAIVDTEDQVVAINGELCHLPYHYLNVGKTRDGTWLLGVEKGHYLNQVVCPLDLESEDYLHIHSMSCETAARDLGVEQEGAEWKVEDIQLTLMEDSSYVKQVNILGNCYSGEEFARLLGLESSAFSVQPSESGMKISVIGVGHGFGLSQNTAYYMAMEGKSYEEILWYFFKDAELVTTVEL